MAHRSGPKAHPLRASAKRSPLIPGAPWPPPGTIEAWGAETLAHVRPPSAVRAIAAHGALEHVPVPRTQPSSGDTNVTDAGLSPRSDVDALGVAGGTGDVEAAGGVADGAAIAADGAVADDAADGMAEAAGVAAEAPGVATLPDPVGCPPAGRFPPLRLTISAATAMTTTAAAARFTASRATLRSPRTPARGDGSRDGISPIRATSSSGAGPAAEARSEARTSRSKDSSLFMAWISPRLRRRRPREGRAARSGGGT